MGWLALPSQFGGYIPDPPPRSNSWFSQHVTKNERSMSKGALLGEGPVSVELVELMSCFKLRVVAGVLGLWDTGGHSIMLRGFEMSKIASVTDQPACDKDNIPQAWVRIAGT